jgi:YbbR domain-containing protein
MSNRFINLFVQDYPRKLLALLFAVILYKGVSDNIFVEREITGVPVDVKLSSDLIFQTGQKNLVTIKIKCSERTLKELNPEDFAASVYVGPEHRQNDDIYLVRLRPEMFKQKNGVKIIRSQSLELKLQRKISKRIPVKVQFSGNLSNEYRTAASRSIPDTVMVSGPELTLNSFSNIFSEPIPLSETVRDPFEYESKLVTPDGVDVSPRKVMVQVDIVKSFEEKRMGNLPVLLVQSNDKTLQATLAEPEQRAEATASGLPSRLSVLDSKDIRLFADLSEISKPGVYTVPLRFSCALDGVSLKAVVPGEVQVKVVKLP